MILYFWSDFTMNGKGKFHSKCIEGELLRSTLDLNIPVINGLTESIDVTAGVKQGCLLSPLLFLMVLDDVKCRVTSRGRRGLPWTSENDLEDIDFADDLCLIATTREQLQDKAEDLAEEAEKEGLRINYNKTKEMC
ncbi:uncharacterized protein LOC133520309 [Cydia pomonella]|uniref:uncharacterized protein LOC133520309 n=1 Tax=Cydia pomonella TaxID=82600 RepID=UPI002ADDAAA6|nr:uncharacterized protein LOC133520309 [Cydia pomonella]